MKFEVEVPDVRPDLASLVEQRYPTTADSFQLSPEDFAACAIGAWSIPREAVPTNHRLQRLMAFAAGNGHRLSVHVIPRPAGQTRYRQSRAILLRRLQRRCGIEGDSSP